jgi:uncharacterized Zn ribbon protein
MDMEADYRRLWEGKTTKQIEKELKSWQRHFAKHEAAYKWHRNMTATGELSDGDRVRILKDILRGREQ